MTCHDCESAARDPNHGIYRRDCRGCSVRAISQAPASIRQTYYQMLPISEVVQFKADVTAEYNRRQAIRRATGAA